MITSLPRDLSTLRYVVVGEKTFVDIGEMLPASRSQIVAFSIFHATTLDNLLCFRSPLEQADMDDLEKHGIIDLWILADKINELFEDESERECVLASMARPHIQ
ncbi:hypothetical protein [Agrobacterium cavarae]|uniref:hypothetical protein n=1 Tax=Agrobacterium cavarae TaxID=2528239 RepID=UPI003CFEA7AF